MPALEAISQDVHRLRVAIHDPEGIAKTLLPIARQYGAAYQDSEVRELLGLCAPSIHVNSLWGVTRGIDAFAVMIQQEKESLQILWSTNFRAVTSNTFVREGTVVYKSSSRKDHVFFKFFSRPATDKITEHVVIDTDSKQIIFRSLALSWQMLLS